MWVCVETPEDGNRGITSSPNNAHASLKKICICTFSVKPRYQRGGSQIFFVPHFESSSRASDVLCDFFRSCSTTNSRKQEYRCEGNRFIEVSDTGSVTLDTELNDWEELEEYTHRGTNSSSETPDTTWVEQDNYEVPSTETSWLIISMIISMSF